MIYMVWDECVPIKFYKCICGSESFTYLNGKNVLHPEISEIVWKFIEKKIENQKVLRLYLEKTKV